MQEELTIGVEGFDEPEAEPAERKLRSILSAIENYIFDSERRAGIVAVALTATILGTLYGAGFTALSIAHHNTRNQSIQRARRMDGEIYTIKNVGNNWIGDTRLYLEDEQGCDAGWVMIHMNNPFTSDVNPLFLLFSDRRYDPLPFPMKVRTHFRPEAWADSQTSDSHENFTGSFLEFERLGH